MLNISLNSKLGDVAVKSATNRMLSLTHLYCNEIPEITGNDHGCEGACNPPLKTLVMTPSTYIDQSFTYDPLSGGGEISKTNMLTKIEQLHIGGTPVKERIMKEDWNLIFTFYILCRMCESVQGTKQVSE